MARDESRLTKAVNYLPQKLTTVENEHTLFKIRHEVVVVFSFSLFGKLCRSKLTTLLDKSNWQNITGISKNICKLAPTTNIQRLCLKSPRIMQLVGLSLNDAVSECHKQFSNEQWDCGARLGAEDISLNTLKYCMLPVRGKENALYHALLTSSSSQALARACSKGHLEDCTCGKLPKNKDKSFMWAGCSDNFKFGNRLTRQIFDSIEKRQNASSLMNVHNNRAGRKLLVKQIERKCKCHGVSGSCSVKTCWNVVPEMPKLVAELHRKYNQAIQVEMAPNSTSLILANQTTLSTSRQQRSLKPKDQKPPLNYLVFIENAPDTCSLRQANGTPLSAGRECLNKQDCDNLCCGRGFISVREVHMVRCNCQFVYCCRVECQKCAENVERFFCK
ncbi:Protein Wnt-4 [Aphelenchoides bicaudatus]|nr:Protein Wnt-4 [Aphelenchoides bicaudatus]